MFLLKTVSKENSFLDNAEGYAISKMANIAFAEGLRKRYPHLEVAVSHPGATKTELNRHSKTIQISGRLGFGMPVDQGALTQVRAAVDDISALSSQHWFAPSGLLELFGNPEVKKTIPARCVDRKNVDALWKLSEELTGIKA